MKPFCAALVQIAAKMVVIILCCAVWPVAALAQQSQKIQQFQNTQQSQNAPQIPARVTLGWGGIISNDYFGDGEDRWRSSSYTASRLRGPQGLDDLPPSFGALREFRMRAENITPADLTAPALDDRRYAGVLSFGLHSHFRPKFEEISLGADVVIIGPQTGLSRLQSRLHGQLGLPSGAPAYGAQFADAVKLSATGEVGRPFALGGGATVRPFVAGEIGVETVLRGGVDVTFGQIGGAAFYMRDATTGQRYNAVHSAQSGGLRVMLGGDIARVWDSYFLPKGGAAQMLELRHRLRAGAVWQGKRTEIFLGAAHLSREFAQQATGQTLGSLSILLRF